MAIQYREEFGAVLRARRNELGLTQSQVADRVEQWLVDHGKREPGEPFDSQNISRWERGKNLGTIDNQEAVAHALETTMADLVARIKRVDQKPRASVNGDVPDDLRAQVQDLHAKVDRIIDALGLDKDADQHPLDQISEIASALPGLLAADDETAAATETDSAGS